MHTRCPNCGTLYHIDEAELKKAHGQVRCYRCSEVFDAFAAKSGAAEGVTADDSLPTDELAQEFRSILNPAEEPSQPIDESSIPSLAFEDLELEDPQLPDPHDTDGFAAELAPDEGRSGMDTFLDGEQAPSPRPHRLLYAGLALLLLATLVGQLLWQQRDVLLQDPVYHRLAEQACQRLGCTLPPLRAPDRFSILERRLIPAGDGQPAMLLKLRARNTADFAQPLPDLQISLLDDNGKTVAQRRLHPDDYLFPARADELTIPPKEVFTIELAFEDPGLRSSGFRLEWL